MNHDFTVCPAGESCRKQQQGSESAAIVQRLEDLMRRCREEGHRPAYQDLLRVRYTGGVDVSGSKVQGVA